VKWNNKAVNTQSVSLQHKRRAGLPWVPADNWVEVFRRLPAGLPDWRARALSRTPDCRYNHSIKHSLYFLFSI